LYYGEEIGMLGEGSHPEVREPFAWDASDFGGFTDRFPWRFNSPNFQTHNVETLKEDPESLWNHYRKLIQARNSYKALQTGEFQLLNISDISIIPYIRKNEEETLLVLINSSFREANIESLDLSGFVDGQATPIAIDILSNRILSNNLSAEGLLEDVELEPYGSHIFRFTDKIPQAGGSISVYPIPTNKGVNILPDANFNMPNTYSYSISNLRGEIVKKGIKSNSETDSYIDLSDLRNGFYILKMTISGRDHFHKIIKN
jgi:hypothetical protein